MSKLRRAGVPGGDVLLCGSKRKIRPNFIRAILLRRMGSSVTADHGFTCGVRTSVCAERGAREQPPHLGQW